MADVRSVPASRFAPQYGRGRLAAALAAARIGYVFLGRELGARRAEPECYVDDTARYDLIARLPQFSAGLEWVRRAVEVDRVALLCAERDPLDCHRAVLVCRHLRAEIGPIAHLREDDSAEPHADFEERLLDVCGLDAADPSRDPAGWVERAYNMQGARLAYARPAADPG